MRVVSGELKGYNLKFPREPLVRPTAEKVKEAIFDVIQFNVKGKKFLDLFAGSGQIGIEALSRGAKTVSFVDNYKDSIFTIKSNISRLNENFLDKVNILKEDVFDFLNFNTGYFDIIFLDPPYGKDIIPKILGKLSRILNYDGIIICEHSKNESLPETPDDLTLFKNKIYGQTAVSFYSKSSA